jgi:hypothetical protein
MKRCIVGIRRTDMPVAEGCRKVRPDRLVSVNGDYGCGAIGRQQGDVEVDP